MTDTDRNKVREWSAGLMRFTEIFDRGDVLCCKNKNGEWIQWTPDLDSAPMWQLKAVIEEMRRRGWRVFHVEQYEDGIWIVPLKKQFNDTDDRVVCGADRDFSMAVLRAGMATGEV